MLHAQESRNKLDLDEKNGNANIIERDEVLRKLSLLSAELYRFKLPSEEGLNLTIKL